MITARPITDYYPEGVPPSGLNRVRSALREPGHANAGAAVQVVSAGLLRFAGGAYMVPPVPFEEGIRLLDLGERLRRLSGSEAEKLAELRALLREAVAIFPRLVRPVGWRRFLWLALPNPFRRASEAEIGQLLGFFLGCRTRSRVGHP